MCEVTCETRVHSGFGRGKLVEQAPHALMGLCNSFGALEDERLGCVKLSVVSQSGGLFGEIDFQDCARLEIALSAPVR